MILTVAFKDLMSTLQEALFSAVLFQRVKIIFPLLFFLLSTGSLAVAQSGQRDRVVMVRGRACVCLAGCTYCGVAQAAALFFQILKAPVIVHAF